MNPSRFAADSCSRWGYRNGLMHWRLGAACIAAAGALGCASMLNSLNTPPPPPPVTFRSWSLPRFVQASESNATQAKDGVTIAVTPVVFQVQKEETVSDGASSTMNTGAKYFCRTWTPTASVTPDRIAFTVTIVNGLDRVFRSAGAVVSLNLDSRAIAFDQSGIKEFLDVIVVPRGQAQVTVWGPPLSVLGRSGTVALFVYDVVTSVDAAGSATKKQNFTWYYSYTLESQSEAVPIRGQLLAVPPGGGSPQPTTVLFAPPCPPR